MKTIKIYNGTSLILSLKKLSDIFRKNYLIQNNLTNSSKMN